MRTSKARSRGTPVDVTAEYLRDATTNSHVVQDLLAYVVNGSAYVVDGHNVVLSYSSHEKEIAELLESELGGEIFMVPRVNSPEGISSRADASICSLSIVIPPIELILCSCVNTVGFTPAVVSIP